MNINRVLFILCSILVVLAVLTVFHFNHSKSARIEYVYADDDVLITNVIYTLEIVRSYESVKEFYCKNNILFFRYAHNTCSNCIFNYLVETLALQEEIGKEHVWIFPAYPEDRSSRLQLNSELSKFNFRNIPTDSLFVPTYNGEQKPYFGLLNKEGKIEMVFIPDINNKLYTQKFFREVKSLFSKRED